MKTTKGIPVCPKCDKGTNREYLYATSTLIYSPTMIDKDGNTSRYDPNTITYTYLCHECGTKYSFDNKGNVFEDKTRFVDSTYKQEGDNVER